MFSITNLFRKFFPYTGKIQSFTFFVPSPPKRKSGYREKEFDQFFYEFINRGYKILETQIVPNNNPSAAGFWIICIVQANKKSAEKLDLASFASIDNPPEGITFDEDMNILSTDNL